MEKLKDLLYIDKLINAKNSELDNLRELAYSLPSQFGNVDNIPNSQSPTTSRTEHFAVKIADLELEISREIQALLEEKQELREKIESMPNLLLRTVLIERYLNFKKWEQIAVDMNYDYAYIQRLHKKALEEYEKRY
jgi:hypothetical protein